MRNALTHARLALVLLLVAAVGVGTIAYLATLTNTETNYFEIGKNPVKIDENDYDWDTKEVRLTMGTGPTDVPSVVRAMIVPYILDSDGNYIACDLADFSEPVNNKMALGDVVLEFASDWSAKWVYGDDGYFYYGSVLYPEAGRNQTSILLTGVSLADRDGFIAKYGPDAEVKIEVLADSLQAEGDSDEKWGITIDLTTDPGRVTRP
ncbi:MAG: hypothetical protein FWG23_00780 [Eggerthellaceae bacterium]|jgi:hypothetical protein|nr:hypothetical protein [Eggerthellaceae bacterium]MDR2715714.1 hypothetical protein [Coriobacteriaceae bacterium]